MKGATSVTLVYLPETISIAVQKEGDEPVRQERTAIVATRDTVSLGLAYFAFTDDQGVVTYRITHVASGADVCPWWEAETEQEVRQWVEALLLLADWTSRVPRPLLPMLQLLQYSIIGVLFECARSSFEGALGEGNQGTNAGHQRRMEEEILAATTTIIQCEKSGAEALDYLLTVLCGMLAGLAGVSATNPRLLTHESCFGKTVTEALRHLLSAVIDKA